jgi:Flp pilus assembly protein TadD
VIAHVLASTPVALAAIAAVLLLRHRTGAAFRHVLLLAAVLRFALPTSWLIAAGAKLAPRFHTSPAVEQFGAVLLHPGVVALAPVVRAAGHRPEPWIALWALGCIASLAGWAVRALRPIRTVRAPNAFETELLAGIPLRIVAADHVPGACGWLRPCVVLPDGLSDHLTPAELRAVAEHEMAHIRRHDNFWAAIIHAVVAVFWFHPLLWWMERRMLAERETACDEMVLRSGADPEDYVAGLAKVCRMSFAGAAGYAGITGSNLATRMEQIMTVSFHRTSSPFPRALAGALLTVLMLLPLAAGFLRAQDRPAPQPLASKVEALVAQGHTDEALAAIEAEIAKNPAGLTLRLMLGNVLVRTGRYDRALAVFHDLAASHPTGDLYLRIGETYRRMGNDAEAIAALGKARELAPDNVTVLSTLALTLDRAGRHNEAARGYRDVLALNSNNGVAMNNLAYLLTENGGDLDQALDYARRAQIFLPDHPEVDDTLGWVYLKRKQAADAFAAFRLAFDQKPTEPAFRSHLAMALDQKRDTSNAAVELKQLLRAPDSPDNQQRIRSLLQAIQ